MWMSIRSISFAVGDGGQSATQLGEEAHAVLMLDVGALQSLSVEEEEDENVVHEVGTIIGWFGINSL